MMQLEAMIRQQEKEQLTEAGNMLQKIEDYIRLGLMPVQDLPLLKRALAHVQNPTLSLPFPERRVFYDFFAKIMGITLNDPTINLITRQRISMRHGTMTPQAAPNIGEGIDLKGTPEGTLVAYANAIKNEIRAGGKPTTNDKALASQAKNELRRRRNVAAKRGGGDVKEEVTYEQKLNLAFEKFGITGLSELDLNDKVAFFSFIDSI